MWFWPRFIANMDTQLRDKPSKGSLSRSDEVCCAPWMGKTRFVIGWAMVGRAEFAHLIAEMAKSAGIMNADIFAQVIWALLYATIIAPFMLRLVLAKYVAQYENDGEDVAAIDEHGSKPILDDHGKP